jgi:hypothetical protein
MNNISSLMEVVVGPVGRFLDNDSKRLRCLTYQNRPVGFQRVMGECLPFGDDQ